MIDISNNNFTLTETLNKAEAGDIIYLGKRIFREKITLAKSNITLIGSGAKIIYSASHGTIIPKEFGGDGIKTFGTTGSATFRVLETANNFLATGISFINEFKRQGCKNGQAVAFKSECRNIKLINCNFISEQDTLYIDNGTNNQVINSSIYGDVDFIFGSANCIFTNCQIVGVNDGYFTAPSTYEIYEVGFVFNNCNFKVLNNAKLALGRPWFPGGSKLPVSPRVSFNNCVFDATIDLNLIKMHSKDPDKYFLKIDNCLYNKDLINKEICMK